MDATASAQSLIGRQLLHYRVVERLGAGGMGVVYKAIDLKLDRAVALKFLPPALCYDEDLKRRFEQEARAASALDHINIGTIYGIEEIEDGQIFIVMAFYEGETLNAMIRRHPINVALALNIAEQIAAGLAAAHQKGIVHRDIKPSNIIITVQGVAKIVDFGLAQLAGVSRTHSVSTAGTVAYMAPEQLEGYYSDHRADLWSLGVVLYEMLNGAPPFAADSAHALLYAVVHKPVPDAAGHVPPVFRAVLRRALSKDPADRYQSALEFLNALRSGDVDQTTQQVNVPKPEEIAHMAHAPLQTGRRSVASVWIVAVALLGLLALAIPFVWPSRTHRQIVSGGPHRLVVLPFTNASHEAANDSLCDGMAEVLTSKLTTLERLQKSLSVVPSGEVRRHRVTTPEEARRVFKANLVVEGTLRKDPKGIRLDIDLIDPVEVREIGSAGFTEPSGDLAAIQDAAVAKLANLLEVNTSPELIKAVAKDTPNVPAAYESYVKGVGLIERYDNPGNLDQAIRSLTQSIQIDGDFALAYAKLGEAYWLKYKSIDKDPKLLQFSRENTNRALTLDSQLPTAYITLGSLDDGEGQHELAVRAFKQALQLDVRNPQAYQGLGRAYESLGRLSEAEAMLRKAIDLDPESWDGYSRLGTFYFRQARYHDAVAQFRRVVQIVPSDALAYSNLGGALLQAGDSRPAAMMFEKSIALSPSYVAYSNLGMLYYNDRRYTDAIRMYEQALAMNDKDYDVWANLADSYLRVDGMSRRTTATYERVAHMAEEYLKANSQDAEALCVLAAARMRLGNHDDALRLATKAVALAQGNSEIELNAAGILEAAGSREQALRLVADALKHGARKENLVEGHPDLEALRRDPRFSKLAAR